MPKMGIHNVYDPQRLFIKHHLITILFFLDLPKLIFEHALKLQKYQHFLFLLLSNIYRSTYQGVHIPYLWRHNHRFPEQNDVLDIDTTHKTFPRALRIIDLQGMAFNPSTITVAAGTTITWTNKDAVTHNVTSNPALFSSGSMGNGATYTFTFANKGTFNYSGTIHPSMTGTVIVN